jgi:hypothetical protein
MYMCKGSPWFVTGEIPGFGVPDFNPLWILLLTLTF